MKRPVSIGNVMSKDHALFARNTEGEIKQCIICGTSFTPKYLLTNVCMSAHTKINQPNPKPQEN